MDTTAPFEGNPSVYCGEQCVFATGTAINLPFPADVGFGRSILADAALIGKCAGDWPLDAQGQPRDFGPKTVDLFRSD